MCILYCMIHSSFVFKICCLILYISSYLAGKFQFLKFLHIIQICVQDLLYFLDTVGHCVPVKIKSLCCKLPGTMLLSKNPSVISWYISGSIRYPVISWLISAKQAQLLTVSVFSVSSREIFFSISSEQLPPIMQKQDFLRHTQVPCM